MQRSGSPMSPGSPLGGAGSGAGSPPRAYSPQRAFSPGSDAGPTRGKRGKGRPRSARASAAGSPPPRGRGRGKGRGGRTSTAGTSRAGSARPRAPRSESAAPLEESDTELEARAEGSVAPDVAQEEEPEAEPEAEPEPEPEDQLLEEDEFSLQKSIDTERKQVMRLLMDAFTPEQYARHEAYRRSRLNKPSVRKVVNHALAQSAPDSVLQVVAGMAKVYVGEVTESARKVMRERGDQGAIQPEHLLEANRRWKQKRERPGHYPPGGGSGAPGLGKRRRLF